MFLRAHRAIRYRTQLLLLDKCLIEAVADPHTTKSLRGLFAHQQEGTLSVVMQALLPYPPVHHANRSPFRSHLCEAGPDQLLRL